MKEAPAGDASQPMSRFGSSSTKEKLPVPSLSMISLFSPRDASRSDTTSPVNASRSPSLSTSAKAAIVLGRPVSPLSSPLIVSRPDDWVTSSKLPAPSLRSSQVLREPPAPKSSAAVGPRRTKRSAYPSPSISVRLSLVPKTPMSPQDSVASWNAAVPVVQLVPSLHTGSGISGTHSELSASQASCSPQTGPSRPPQ